MNAQPQRRTILLLAVVLPLLALFVYVGLRSGPLAPVAVTVAKVESRSVAPALFGIGTVESRYTYKIGPTVAGRLSRLDVQVGDRVRAGQVIGEMDPVDLEDKISALNAASRRAEAAVREAKVRQSHARTQLRRYEQLLEAHVISVETVDNLRKELFIADEALTAASEDMHRARSDRSALQSQRDNVRLVAPAAGVVAVRSVDPGTTVLAGQPVVEVIDPQSIWVNVRFDQLNGSGLASGLPARIELRSRKGQPLSGRIQQVEPKADSVTEEVLAKVVFDQPPHPVPSAGELAEVTVALPALTAGPAIPNAALRRYGELTGVWRVEGNDIRFARLRTGASDLDGFVQVREGVQPGDLVVVYSDKILNTRSRIRPVAQLAGVSR